MKITCSSTSIISVLFAQMDIIGMRQKDHLETVQRNAIKSMITVLLATSKARNVFHAKTDICQKQTVSLVLNTLTTVPSQSKTKMKDYCPLSTTNFTVRIASLASSGAGMTECVLIATLTNVPSVKRLKETFSAQDASTAFYQPMTSLAVRNLMKTAKFLRSYKLKTERRITCLE